MDTLIGNSPFTVEWLADKLQEKRQTARAALKSAQITGLGEGQGFVSTIFRVTLEWADPKTPLPTSVIVKLPTLDALHSLLPPGVLQKLPSHYASMIHQSECEFYHLFGSDDAHPPVPLAKCYSSQLETDREAGVIILEDLASKGDFVPMWEGLSLEKCLSFVDCLAALHAYSLKYPQVLGKFLPRPREVYEVLPDILQGLREPLTSIDPGLAPFLEKMAPRITAEQRFQAANAHEQFGLPPVLAHGDPWMNNLVFKFSTNGKLSDELLAIIDWQEVQAGSMGFDIARFLVSSCPSVLRRCHWETVLTRYHATLHEELRKLGCPFTVDLDTLKALYHKQLLFSCFCFTVEAPMILSGPDFQGEQNESRAAAILERLQAVYEDILSSSS